MAKRRASKHPDHLMTGRELYTHLQIIAQLYGYANDEWDQLAPLEQLMLSRAARDLQFRIKPHPLWVETILS